MAFSFTQPAAPASGNASGGFTFGGGQQQQPQQQQAAAKPAGFGGFNFGASSQNNQQQQQPQGQQPQQQSGQAGGFGSGGIFGSGTANQQPQQQQQQQQQQQPGTTSLFGGAPQGNKFGQTQPQPGQPSSLFGNPSSSSSLFGRAQQQQQPQQPQLQPQQQQLGQPSGGLFGSLKPFGQNATSTPVNPLTLSQLGGPASYQQQQASRPGQQGLFGSSTSASVLGSSGNDPNAYKRQGALLNEKLENIRAAWDMQNIQTCQFLYYFYNAIPPQQAQLGEMALRDPNFGRRQDAVGPRHDGLWLQTLRENPDRSKLVPVLAVGFPDLKARVDAQQAETARQSGKLGELQKRLDDLTAKHSLSNSVRISAISRKQTSLHHRLVGLAKRIHLLIPALRGHSITLKEEQLKNLLQMCEMELEAISSMTSSTGGLSGTSAQQDGQRSGVHHRLRGRINELWALLGTLKAKREAAALAHDGNAPLEWAVVDDSAIEDVVKILASQQQGLDHLSSTLQNDTRALDTIIQGLEGVELIVTK